jgi:hypothetical protein
MPKSSIAIDKQVTDQKAQKVESRTMVKTRSLTTSMPSQKHDTILIYMDFLRVIYSM